MAAKYTFAPFKSEYPDEDACLAEIFRRCRAYACQRCRHRLYPCAETVIEKSSACLTLWFRAQ